MMAKRSSALTEAGASATGAWAERYEAARRAAEQEIASLRPGEAFVYHEGNLAVDTVTDPAAAGRGAAFRAATEAEKGLSAQRRLGFERYRYIFWRIGREQR